MAKGIYVGVETQTETWQTVSGDIIPKSWSVVTAGTSYTSTAGIKLTASSYLNSGREANRACNNKMSDFWISGTETNPWIALEFPTATKITKMNTLIWGANAVYFQNAKIQGSNNDDTWVDLYTVTSNQGDSTATEPVEVVLGNADFYKYYRIYYTFNSSTGGTARLSEWRTVEYATPVSVIKSVARKVKKAYVGVVENSLVANGDFESGLEGWTNLYTSYISLSQDSNGYSGKCAKIEVVQPYSGSSGFYIKMSNVSLIQDHIYYLYGYCKGLSSNSPNMYSQIQFIHYNSVYGGTKIDGNLTAWSRSSLRYVATRTASDENNAIGLYVRAGTTEGATAGMAIYWDNVAMYDLTAMYGAGNEPTQEWCDNNLEALKDKQKTTGIARKIKKGYIGVSGVARPFFSAEPKLEYYGTAATLSQKAAYLAATTVGDYALFAGGARSSSTYNKTVNAYTSTLAKSTASDLGTARSYPVATNVGNYALFGGGYDGSYLNNVDAYSSSLVKSSTTLSVARRYLAATRIGNYALFGGGRQSGSNPNVATVDTYTSTLTKVSVTDLAVGRAYLTATSVGNYALFAGGIDSDARSAIVDTYTSALVKGTTTRLSNARSNLAATTVGSYALFGGGLDSTYYTIVDTYNSSLAKGTASQLSVARQYLSATTVGEYALFGGGSDASYSYKTVDVYTATLAKSTAEGLSTSRRQLAATSTGDYALFGGGIDGSSYDNTVDVYQLVES